MIMETKSVNESLGALAYMLPLAALKGETPSTRTGGPGTSDKRWVTVALDVPMKPNRGNKGLCIRLGSLLSVNQ